MAETFDLILSEYAGYTDESLLDLPMRRIRQMAEVIRRRRRIEREFEEQFQLSVAEMSAQAVAGMLPGLAQSKKTGKAMAKMAQSISFLKQHPAWKRRQKRKGDEIPSTDAVLSALGAGRGGVLGRRR